jgi:hypothetical protein
VIKFVSDLRQVDGILRVKEGKGKGQGKKSIKREVVKDMYHLLVIIIIKLKKTICRFGIYGRIKK